MQQEKDIVLQVSDRLRVIFVCGYEAKGGCPNGVMRQAGDYNLLAKHANNCSFCWGKSTAENVLLAILQSK